MAEADEPTPPVDPKVIDQVKADNAAAEAKAKAEHKA
jgi:sec-independent protein translocase protein TatA